MTTPASQFASMARGETTDPLFSAVIAQVGNGMLLHLAQSIAPRTTLIGMAASYPESDVPEWIRAGLECKSDAMIVAVCNYTFLKTQMANHGR